MNQERRKQLAKALDLIQQAHSIIEQVRDDEQGAFDNMPESLQQADRGADMGAAIDIMDNELSHLECAMDELGSIANA